MAHITVQNANAWTDKFKLNLGSLDSELEDSLATQIIAKISAAYDVTTWVDETSTPSLVKKIIAMEYVGWYFQRTYSEDGKINEYGVMLVAQAEELIAGIVSGAVTIPDVPVGTNLGVGQPLFYPTDASSALEATVDDMSLGSNKFSMGTIW